MTVTIKKSYPRRMTLMKLIFSGYPLPKAEITEKMIEAADSCLKEYDIRTEDIEISVSFVDERAIKELNSTYRDKNSKTDVLSFPQYNTPEEIPKTGMTALGDIVICGPIAKKQAKEAGHSEKRELVYLFVHSMLHLLGHDHMKKEEKKLMRETEEKIMHSIDTER